MRSLKEYRLNSPASAMNWRQLAVIALCVALTAGCTPGMSDLETYVARVKAIPPKPLEPLPVMRQFETFEYQAQSLRDPFSNPTEQQEAQAGSTLRPDPDRPKEPLEAYPLDSLDMVGTLGDPENIIVMVMDPERVIHRVMPGQYMGQNDGRVTGVFEDRIELTELVPDGAGGWMERQAQVALDDN